jgi:hypothetical protein
MRYIIVSAFLFFYLCFDTILLIAQVDSVPQNIISLNVSGIIVKIPYFRNISLESYNTHIKRAVIIIHGMHRDAEISYNSAYDAVNSVAGEIDSTLIIAPQFLQEEDILAHSLDSSYLFWSDDGGWKSGSVSSNSSPDINISSYAVLDTILSRIVKNNPDLQIIVVTGHSAGGQVVNRYAACSPYITTVCGQNHIAVRFIASNPSSYLYMTYERYMQGTLDQFAVPATSCSTYNDWKYGLDNLFIYPGYIGAKTIKKQYKEREVVYLLGGADTLNSNDMDTACEAMLQGENRLQRGTIYYNYIAHVYSDSIYHKHIKTVVPGIGHEEYEIFTSTEGVNHILRMDTLNLCDFNASAENIVKLSDINIYPNPVSDLLNIEFEKPLANSMISISNSYGQCIIKENLKYSNSCAFNVSSWYSGVYILNISTDQGQINKKIIISK